MNCSDILELAPLYHTGELEPARADEFSSHLRGCASCLRELEGQRSLDSLLRTAVIAEAVDCSRLEANVRRAIVHESRRWFVAVAGIAAVLMIALAVRTIDVVRATAMFAAAARDHHLEIVEGRPRKWVTSHSELGALAQANGVPASAIEAIAPAGYHVEKGKICVLDGQFVLHLVYANGGANFSVFLRRARGSRSVRQQSRGAEHVAGFEQHQLAALIVTTLPGDAARRFALSAAAAL